MKSHVICLPGGVAPSAQRYAPLIDALGPEVQIHFKDHEVYAADAPPPDYSVELELHAIDRFADSLGIDRFHLVGYSGGGFLSLAYAGTRGERLASLALFEPAMVPGHLTPRERTRWSEFDSTLAGLEGPEFMSAFMRMQLKPAVQLPPPPAAPWPGMQKRPAGIAAMMRSFAAYEFERESMRACTFPVYLGYGDQTHEFETVKASVLVEHFPDIWVQRYPGVHHFVPPAQIYTAAHATSLRELWQRAENSPLRPQLSLQE
jgi:pimeloyl-ACP methyl ester carboxylesterase